MSGGNKGDQVQVKIRGNILSHPVYAAGGTAVAAIHRGTMVMINAVGFALQASDAASAIFAGISEEAIAAKTVTNQAGAPNVRVRRKGIFKMKMDATSKVGTCPFLVGSLVYVCTAQGVAGGADETIGLSAQCTTGYVLVGKIVKHGTDAQAKAGTADVADVWVDIAGVSHSIYANANYTLIADLISTNSAKGAKLVGYDDSTGEYTAVDVADALDEIATKLTEQGVINLPLMSFLDEGEGTLAALAVFSSEAQPSMGFSQEGTEELGVRWNNHATPRSIITQFPKPLDMDTTADMVIHILAAKSAAGADLVAFTVEVYDAIVGAAINASADLGVESTAMADNVNIQELTSTILAAGISATTGAITLNIGPKDGTLDADDVTVLAIWIEYTKLWAASA